MELSETGENQRPFLSSDNPVREETSKMNRTRIILASLVSVALLIIVTVLCVLFIPGDDSKPPPSPHPPTPWMEVSPKLPFSLKIHLRSSSDTNSGVGGQVSLCSQGRCCVTDRLQFKDQSMVYLSDEGNCSDFQVEKREDILFKVLNEDPEKIQFFRLELILADGESYNARFSGSTTKSEWSKEHTLKLQNIAGSQATRLKVNFKNVKENPSEATYVKGTRIELKIQGDAEKKCFTNPLPWPDQKGTEVLEELKWMGPCFTYNLMEAGDKLMVRYQAPNNAPFTVSKIMILSFEPSLQAATWTVRKPQPGEWVEAEFDEG